MRPSRWTAGVAALVLATLGTTPAAAAAAKPVIATYTAMAAVPTHVATHATLAFSLTFTQSSSFRLNLDGLGFEVWNRCLCPPDDTDGTVATYLDPTTGGWRSTPPAAGDAYLLELSTHLTVLPGQKVTIPVRLTMTPFRDGSYTLADNGTIVGNALDANGNFIEYTWQPHEAGDRHFTLGSATAPATHASSAPKPRSAQPTATHRASPSPLPAVSLSPAPAQSPSASSTPLLAVPTAQIAPSGFGWWLPALLAGGASALLIVYALRRRRGRRSVPDADSVIP